MDINKFCRLERILMMLYVVQNSQNYWVFGLSPSSSILENTTFRKLNLFPSSGEVLFFLELVYMDSFLLIKEVSK
jgi:hypothetical protein